MADKDTTSKKKERKGSLKEKLRIMTIVPIVIMGIFVTVLSYYVFLNNIQKEVRNNLSSVAKCTALYYDHVFPGDYSAAKVADDQYIIYKGGEDISATEPFFEQIKEETGADVTLFYYDIRMLTTLSGVQSGKALYTIANKAVSDAVINGKSEQFYNNMEIDGETFFVIYIPIFNDDGSCVGMISAGKPTGQVEKESRRSLYWIPILTLIMTVLASLMSVYPARSLVGAINKEKKFLDEISKGNLNASIDKEIIERDDELGDMGRFSRGVQKFLKEMIERDTLTRLYTRRVGASKIAYTRAQFDEAGVKYCVCMGDIDFFKKFNDTYGHDCGDLVLRDIASIFNEFMLGKGFAVRWGGEEFLIIFEDADLKKALDRLRVLRQRVLDHELEYNGEKLSVTMTFGLTQGDMRDIDEIVKEADELLYIGKQNGRNRIVTPQDAADIEESVDVADEQAKELSEIREK